MAIEIWWSSGSCPSWRVLLALELKGLAYQSHRLDLSRRQQKAPEILAMNPRGKMPVLRDGDMALYESIAILAYLERAYPDPPLFGADAVETGRIWRLVSECLCYFEPAVDAICLPVYRGKTLEAADALKAAAGTMHRELDRFEQSLGTAPWFGGARPSAADLAHVPHFGHLLRAAGKPEVEPLNLGLFPLQTRHPAAAAWWRRIQELPGFDRTSPPHWKP